MPDAPAVDRGDDGLGDARQRSSGDPAQTVLEAFAADHRSDVLPFGRMSFQVGTGGERIAGAGDDRDAKRIATVRRRLRSTGPPPHADVLW